MTPPLHKERYRLFKPTTGLSISTLKAGFKVFVCFELNTTNFDFFCWTKDYLPGCRGYRTRDAVVAVEQLPPKELISGDSQPLPAGQTCLKHIIMGKMQEDLQHQAVRQDWATLHPNILCTTHTSHVHGGDVMSSFRLSSSTFVKIIKPWPELKSD